MAKKVRVKSGRTFDTLSAAKEHFGNIRRNTEPNGSIPEPERSDIIDIYERYCEATGYAEKPTTGEFINPKDVVGLTTMLDNRQRPNASYASTKAYAVISASGELNVFSIDKALTAIAT